MTDDSPAIAVGTLIDERHRIEGLLGTGGFATVYKGRDIETGGLVAIKVLNGAHQPKHNARARFDREVDAVSKLQSPHTVRLYGSGQAADGTPFIVFEHVGGRDLTDVLKEHGQLDPTVARHILEQVLASLREAHEAGVLHRDIKPANVRIFEHDGDPWTVKVLDFGIARLIDPEEARITQTGELLGTPRYMSPEQLLSRPLGPGSDIYSAGILALEMLLGGDALHGHSLGDQLDRLHTGHLFAPGTEQSRLQEVVGRMTARDLKKRFQSIESVQRAMNAPPALDSPRPMQEHNRPALPTELEPVPRAEASLAPRASRGVLIAVAASLIIACAVALGLVVQYTSEPASVPPPRPAIGAGSALLAPEPDREPRAETPVVDVGRDVGRDVGQPRGCGVAREAGTHVMHAMVPGELIPRPRAFSVYVPRGYDPEAAHPVVMLFQTTLVEPTNIVQGSGAKALADREQFLVLSFEYKGMMFEEHDEEYVAAALETVGESLCIDRQRVFAFGHGKGGRFVRSLDCDVGVTAIATLGDFGKDPKNRCRRPVAQIRFSGRSDGFAPLRGGANCVFDGETRSVKEFTAAWREVNQCKGPATTWSKSANPTCRTWTCAAAPLVACEYEGGHMWEGETINLLGQAAPPNCNLDKPIDFDVLAAAWKFFQEQEPREVGGDEPPDPQLSE